MARRATCTTSTSTMPAAIETRPRGPDFPDVTRSLWARLQRSPIGGCSRSVYRAIRASLRARHRERPRSNRLRSCLILHQTFDVSLAMLDCPCDPGNPSTARPIGRRFPGSHGPAEEKASALAVNVSLRFDGMAGSTDFSFLRAPGSPSRCHPGRPDRSRDSSPPRSNRRLQAHGAREVPQPKPRCVAPPGQIGCRGPPVRERLEKEAGCASAVLKFPGT
jgi:hypothetical protein